MNCSKCGAKILYKAKYCAKCGEPAQLENLTKKETETESKIITRNITGIVAKIKGNKAAKLVILVFVTIFLLNILLGSSSDQGTDSAKQTAIQKAITVCEEAGYTVDDVSAVWRDSSKQRTGNMGYVYEIDINTLQRGWGKYLIGVVEGENVCEAVLVYPYLDFLFGIAEPDFETKEFSDEDIQMFQKSAMFDPNNQ